VARRAKGKSRPAKRPPANRPGPKPVRAASPLGRILRGLVILLLVFGLVGPVAVVTLYAFVPPPLTFLMVQRVFEGRGFDRRWVPLSQISPRLVGAVIASEDSGFCQHHGFDFHAMERALAHNQADPGKIRGGSTISQQTANNVFLWPHRDYVRKGLEAYFTALIELIWGKARIMEVYLNSIEWGPGVYGAEAAAQTAFGVPARSLTPGQAARLAVILPKPLSWKADRPGRYVRKRSGTIVARAGVVRRQGLADCVYRGD
jgi:monofunctional biosynthetic peptidoglycan transglycosylase